MRDVLIVAIGDSISAGEGIPHRIHDRPRDQVDQWWESRCHRSFFNFSLIATMTAAEQAPGTTFTYFNFACSGATISKKNCGGSNDPSLCQPGGLLDGYEGIRTKAEMEARSARRRPTQIDGHSLLLELPSQLESVKQALKLDVEQDGGSHYRPVDYVVMTIGGNDVLFGKLVLQSLIRTGCEWNASERLLSIGTKLFGSGWQPTSCLFKEAEALLAELDREFEKLEKSLDEVKPANVLIAGYIDPTHDESQNICADEKTGLRRRLGPGLAASAGYVVDSKEAERAYRDIINVLNFRIAEFTAARSALGQKTRWRYLDPNVIGKSQRRGWCGTPSWFVNYEDSQERQNNQAGTAHPNIYGQNWLNWLVRCQLSQDKIIPARLVCPDPGRDRHPDYKCDCAAPKTEALLSKPSRSQ